jgi:rubredoxin
MADPVDPDALPHGWTIVQGWRSADVSKGGHTFLIVDVHRETERVLILESNYAFGMNGPGFRELGDVEAFMRRWRCPAGDYLYDPAAGDPDRGVPPGTSFEDPVLPAGWVCPVSGHPKAAFRPLCEPPRDWWKEPKLQTWTDLRRRYPDGHRAMARLRIHDLAWVR